MRIWEWEMRRLFHRENRRNPEQCFQLAVVTLGAICLLAMYGKAHDRSR